MKVSFVIPTFNCQTWLPHAVKSCLEQTYKDIEVIIIDDASTDYTIQYLDFIKSDARVKVIKNMINLGRSYSRNSGNNSAQGDIICVLDADDLATPNRAELTVRKFKSSPADYIYGGATIIDALGSPINIATADVFSKEKSVKDLKNYIVHSTAAYTRQFSEKYPYRMGEFSKLGIDDWAQQVEALSSGAKFDFLTQRLGCYRILSSQITKTRDESKVIEAKMAFLESLKVPA